jgi:hypothetical protein
MQIICPPDSPSVVIDDYLRNGEPLVICAEHSAPSIAISDPFDQLLGDGSPFALTYHETRGYTAYFSLVAGKTAASANGLGFRIERTSEEIRPVLVVARAPLPQTAIHWAIEESLRVTGSLGKLLLDKPPLPAWLDRVGWVSSRVPSHAQILEEIEALPVQPGYVLIEGDWQGADPERFPVGLRGLSQALRERGVPHLGVAHPLMGQTGENLGETFQFFFDFYAQLKEEGVTFVQVDYQEVDSPRHVQIAIQAAAAIHFNSALFNRNCLETENLFHWTTSRLVRTNRAVEEHLHEALWLQHMMYPVPPPPSDEAGAMLSAVSGAPQLIDSQSTHLEKLLLPSGTTLRANAPLTLCDDSLFGNPPLTKAFTYKSGCGIVATFAGHGTASPSDFDGTGTFAVHTHQKGYLGIADEPVEVSGTDIVTFAPIVNGVGLFGHPHFFLLPGPLQEMHHDDETIHISSRVTAPLLLYCERNVLEVRCNGEVVPWGHDKAAALLTLCEGRELVEQPSLYTISFES